MEETGGGMSYVGMTVRVTGGAVEVILAGGE